MEKEGKKNEKTEVRNFVFVSWGNALVIISNKKLLLATEEYYVELRKKFRHTPERERGLCTQ